MRDISKLLLGAQICPQKSFECLVQGLGRAGLRAFYEVNLRELDCAVNRCFLMDVAACAPSNSNAKIYNDNSELCHSDTSIKNNPVLCFRAVILSCAGDNASPPQFYAGDLAPTS